MTRLNAVCGEFDFLLDFEALPYFLSNWPEIAIFNGNGILAHKEPRSDEENMFTSHVLESNIFPLCLEDMKSDCFMANLLHAVVLHLRKEEVIAHQILDCIVYFCTQETLQQVGKSLLEKCKASKRGACHDKLLVCLNADLDLVLTKYCSFRILV